MFYLRYYESNLIFRKIIVMVVKKINFNCYVQITLYIQITQCNLNKVASFFKDQRVKCISFSTFANKNLMDVDNSIQILLSLTCAKILSIYA